MLPRQRLPPPSRPLRDGDQMTTTEFPSAAARAAAAAALVEDREGHHHRVERSRGPAGHGRDPHPAKRHRRRPPRGRRGLRAGRPRGQGRAGRRRRRPTGRRPGLGAPVRFGAQPDHRGAYGAELPAAHVRHRDADRPLRPSCGRDQGAHPGHAQDGAGPARPGQVRGHRRRRPQPPPRSRGDGPAQGEPHRRGGAG